MLSSKKLSSRDRGQIIREEIKRLDKYFLCCIIDIDFQYQYFGKIS